MGPVILGTTCHNFISTTYVGQWSKMSLNSNISYFLVFYLVLLSIQRAELCFTVMTSWKIVKRRENKRNYFLCLAKSPNQYLWIPTHSAWSYHIFFNKTRKSILNTYDFGIYHHRSCWHKHTGIHQDSSVHMYHHFDMD